MKKLARATLPSLAGALSGAVIAIWAGRSFATPPLPAASASFDVYEPERAATSLAHPRNAFAQAVQPASPATGGAAESPRVAAAHSMDPQAERAAFRAEYERALAIIASEPTDAGWAREATERLAPVFDAVAQDRGFAHVGTECRSNSCVATFEWSDKAAAVAGAQALVLHRYPLNCKRGVHLPEDDRTGPVQAKLLLMCDERSRELEEAE